MLGAGAAGDGSFSVVACRGGMASRSTSDRVPAYLSAIAADSAATVRAEDRLGADDTAQRRQPADVVGLAAALDQEPVDVLAGEPDLHPGAGHRLLGHRGRDQVVERLVEVRQRQVDQHPRHRVHLGRLDLGRLPPTRRRRLRLRGVDGLAHAGEELLLCGAVGHGLMSTSGWGRGGVRISLVNQGFVHLAQETSQAKCVFPWLTRELVTRRRQQP